MSPPKLNPVEPPWYGPVCPVVGEGWHREVSPYPDLGSRAEITRLPGMVSYTLASRRATNDVGLAVAKVDGPGAVRLHALQNGGAHGLLFASTDLSQKLFYSVRAAYEFWQA